MSSACLEPDSPSSGRRLYIQSRYGAFYMHQYMQLSRQKSVFDTIEQSSEYKSVFNSIEHTLVPTSLLILMHVKRNIP